MSKDLLQKRYEMSVAELMETEIWVDVEGYEGVYHVSSFSRVKSLHRTVNTGNGGFKIIPEKILKLYTDKSNDNVTVTLTKKSVGIPKLLCRLLGVAFLPNSENKPTINHGDGNRRNNALNNIEWNTWSENNKHAHRTGLNKARNLPDNRRKVAMYDLRSNHIRTFNSMSEAASFIKADSISKLVQCCKGKSKKSSGYKWAYV